MSGGPQSAQTAENAARRQEAVFGIAEETSSATAESGGLSMPRKQPSAREERQSSSAEQEQGNGASNTHPQDAFREVSYKSFFFPVDKDLFGNSATSSSGGDTQKENHLAATAFEFSRFELLRTAPRAVLPHCQLILISFKHSSQACVALAALSVEERTRQTSQPQLHRVFFLVGASNRHSHSADSDTQNSSSSRSVIGNSGNDERATRSSSSLQQQDKKAGDVLVQQSAAAEATAVHATREKKAEDEGNSHHVPRITASPPDRNICWELWAGQTDVSPVAAIVIYTAEQRLLRKKGNFYVNLLSLASRMIEAFQLPAEQPAAQAQPPATAAR